MTRWRSACNVNGRLCNVDDDSNSNGKINGFSMLVNVFGSRLSYGPRFSFQNLVTLSNSDVITASTK